jgi:Aerotolerance regulator N-terminal
MIAALFLNPGFLFLAAALISVPIIIHLINRMRFKRIRWAAMEFLLKAQKRTRRRLIIEQLLLLALRCLLLALVGLLVLRFTGCGDNNFQGKPNLHLVILDDTLSMQDHWKGPEGTKNCLDVAKEILTKKIGKGLAQSKTNDRLIILPLSRIDDPNYEVKAWERLNDPQNLKELTTFINEMQPSMLHVNLQGGIKAAKKIITNYPESAISLHVISDFRSVDWAPPAGEGLTKELLDLVEHSSDIKVRPIDTVHPPRAASQGGYPPSRDNVGILDVTPSSRIVGKKMVVRFTVRIQNFSGKQVEAHLAVRNEDDGKDMEDVDFTPQNPLKLSPSSTSEVFFDYGDVRHGLFRPNKDNFAHLSVRLTNAGKGQLDNDGILADNIRHTVVEVRDKVPILVIDGAGSEGRKENKDSFFLRNGLISIPGGSYDVIFGDEVARPASVNALEQADLSKYASIFLLNVHKLNADQLKNLENYAKEGGGVGFYMGPTVDTAYYNKELYKAGNGVFPVPLKTTYYPGPNEPEIPTKKDSDTYQLITRDEKFPKGGLPIFGAMFEEPKQREPLSDLPIHRYFKVDRGLWKPEPGRVFELATLPNEDAAVAFGEAVASITLGENVRAILANPELAKYRSSLEKHLADINRKVQPGTEFRAYHLANQIETALNDKGDANAKDQPNMTVFWDHPDAKVQSVKRDLNNLREQVNYGDPFVITQTFGKGKVVAVMSTVGKDWNDWAGGSVSQVLFPMFIWEMQKYLSSSGTDANLTVGTNLPLTLNAKQFQGKNLKLVREYMKKAENGVNAVPKEIDKQFGKPDGNEILFSLTNNREPGLYISRLFDENEPEKPALAVYAHVFNVDTAREGQLQRIGSEELERELQGKSKSGAIRPIVGANAPDTDLVSKTNDFSESPWLFLILLLVLVAEQALAVHLSFHLKNTEDDRTPAGVKA